MDQTSAQGITELKELIRGHSLKMLQELSKINGFELKRHPQVEPVLSHWMTLILISGTAVKITFKAHYMTQAARILSSDSYSKEPQLISEDQAIDFVREFCNLTAGMIKKSLLELQLKTGVSLPIVTRGFDELFFSPGQNSNVSVDTWGLTHPKASIVCSVVIEIFEPVDFSKLNKVASGSGGGEVEFL